MGQERACTVQYGGRSFEGKALLETAELLFRGETRLKIPFKEMTRVEAVDGALTVEFAGGTAVFQIGAAAEKWASKILSPPGRLDKLGVKEGTRVRWIGEPDTEFRLEAEQRGAVFVRTRPDLTFLAVGDAKALEEMERLPPGPVWVVYKKGRRELSEVDVIKAGRAAGRVDVKVVSFSKAETGLKFVEKS